MLIVRFGYAFEPAVVFAQDATHYAAALDAAAAPGRHIQRLVLERRAADVAALYAEPPDPRRVVLDPSE